MLARLLILAVFLASLMTGPVDAQQRTGADGGLQSKGLDQGKELIETRSAEPTGRNLYTNSHALIIGVNTYPNLPKQLQLKFAVNDATAVRDMLVQNYGFDPSEVTLLTNEKATIANIRRELSQLASSKRVKPDDRILLYFSGHGQTVKLPTGVEMGFLIPTDAKIDMSDPSDAGPYLETCLPMKQVWDYLASSPAKHACVIADACFSGMMASSRSVTMSQDTVNAMLARPARQVLTAGGAGQKTFERADLGHGIFTFKLLEELKARAADKGKVFSLMDLYTSLQSSVSNLSGGKQLPQFGSVDTEGQLLFCSGGLLSANANPGGGSTGGVDGSITGSTGGKSPDPTPPVNQVTRAKLTITSNAPGATLTLNGAKKGPMPYMMQVDLKSAGEQTYTIRVEAKGYIPAETSVTLKPGDDLSVPVDLKQLPVAPPPVTTAKLNIDSTPSGASVFVDGKPAGMTPVTVDFDLKNKPQQSYRVRVELAGYVAAQSTVTVKRGEAIGIPFELKPVPVIIKPTQPTQPPRKRNVKQLALSEVSTLQGSTPVNAIAFSPDGKRLAVSGLDYSLTLYDTGNPKPKRVAAPKNTIVRITPDWKHILFIKLLTDGQRTWASVTVQDAKTQQEQTPMRVNLKPGAALDDVYVGNTRLVMCGSFGQGDARSGMCTVADFVKGEATTFTGGYRITTAASSADDSTYAVYVEPLDIRSPGYLAVIPADLSRQPTRITTADCNSTAGVQLSEDGKLVAVTCQRITASGADVIGTSIFDSATGTQVQFLPRIRVAALIGKGTRILGWRTQIGGAIVELLDTKSGNGLGETPGGEVWLSRDEKLAAQAAPDGTITLYRLNQP